MAKITKQDFMKIVKAIQTYYPRADAFPKTDAIALWYEELNDLTYEQMTTALRRHVATSKWSPTIAELREQCVEIEIPVDDWGVAWEELQRAIRNWGWSREEEAYASMSDLTRQTVRRLGYQYLCESQDQMADRANFRNIYEQLKGANKVNQQVKPTMRVELPRVEDRKVLEHKTEDEKRPSEKEGAEAIPSNCVTQEDVIGYLRDKLNGAFE